MLQKIKLNYGYGGWKTVWAWVDGNLAIHKNEMNTGWLLTHVPTGMGLDRGYEVFEAAYSKEEIIKKLERYKSFEWRGKNPLNEFEPCELLQIAPLITKDKKIGLGREDVEYWRETMQEPASFALSCKQDTQS